MREPRVLVSSEAAERPIFGFLSGLASLSFAMLVLETAWVAIPGNGGPALAFNATVVFFLVADSLFDLYIRFRSPSKLIAIRKLRAVAVLAIVSYAALSPLTMLPFPDMFLPHPVNIAGMIAIVFESLVVYGIRGVLFSRSQLYEMLSQQGESENIMELFSANARLVFDAYDQARVLQRTAVSLFVVSTLLALTNAYIEGVGFFISFWYFLTLVTLFGMLSVANNFLDEHRFYAHGIVAPPKFQRIRQDWAYLTLIVCLVVSLLISNAWSPLKPSDIIAFFAWLFSLFGKPNPSDIDKVQQTVNKFMLPPEGAQLLYNNLSVDKPSPFWPIFFEVLKWVAIVAVVGLALFFVLRPLLTSEFKLRASLSLFFRQLGSFLFEPFRAIAIAIKRLFAWRPRRNLANKQKKQTTNPQEYISAIIKSALSGGKSRDRLAIRSLAIYADFLEWLYEREVRWTLADTPYDIAELSLESFSLAFANKNDSTGGESSKPGKSVTKPSVSPEAKFSATLAKAEVAGFDHDGAKQNLSKIADILEKDLFSREHATQIELDTMNTAFFELKKSV